jgi:hypothetical protein
MKPQATENSSAGEGSAFTAGALRAAIECIATIKHDYSCGLCPDSVVAAIIDRETGLPDLLAALRRQESTLFWLVNLEDVPESIRGSLRGEIEAVRQAIAKAEGRG